MKKQSNKNRKDFTIVKWIIFPPNSVILAGAVSYFNLSVFGYREGLPYTLIVCLIGVFSILINKYTESENRKLARAAFVFEIFLTLALIINATYSIAIQRKMSVARMATESRSQTIGEISRLKGARTQREALQHLEKTTSAQTIFTANENILFLIMAGELALYGLASFTLFAIAKLVDDDQAASVKTQSQDDFPEELDTNVTRDDRSGRRLSQTIKSDNARQSCVSTQETFDRKAARRKLLEHLRLISHYCPGRWFKADLIEGGVHIRMCARINGLEETIAETRQSNKCLTAVDNVNFRQKLTDELIRNGFPIEQEVSK